MIIQKENCQKKEKELTKKEAALAFLNGSEMIIVSVDGVSWRRPRTLTEIDQAQSFFLDDETKFKCGDRFQIVGGVKGDVYMLSCVDDTSFALINLRTGNRYSDPVKARCALGSVPASVVLQAACSESSVVLEFVA